MSNFFGFRGRIGRGTWWLSRLVLVIIIALVVAAALALHDDDKAVQKSNATLFLTILLIGGLLFIVIDACTTVKRYHDRGKSGFWYWISLIPFGGIWQLVDCGFLAGDDGDNNYGPPPGAGRSTPGFDDEIRNVRSNALNRLDDDYMTEYAKQLAEKTSQEMNTASSANVPTLGAGGTRPSFGKR